ncbi:hypothetical protein PVAND_004954 [Polypedilum vanderplanki]|uniref:Uncharacterized protein n=1 Tax=Polypedilum vanderplanki TaxID=319348 RepID=A0A9J6C0K8_POLVA|nr:hypothetical protein PVAND_004954 [Polypedilum vanderplanki]
MKVIIVALTFALVVNARPQDYDDYDQPARPAARPNNNNQKSHHQQSSQKRNEERETSTWIPIIQYDKEQDISGSYKTHYETGNNIIAEESGYLKDVNEEGYGTLVQKGSYSYETPDGQIINVEYQADEQGFRVNGDHLPTPPPVSPEIQKGLDLIYAGIRLQEERRKNNPNYVIDEAERKRLNYLGLWTGN